MITRGLYRHYKGECYFVESVGQSHSNADEGTPRAAVRWVLYQSTQSCATGDGITRMRPESEFAEDVDPKTGESCDRAHSCVCTSCVPRFTRIGAP